MQEQLLWDVPPNKATNITTPTPNTDIVNNNPATNDDITIPDTLVFLDQDG